VLAHYQAARIVPYEEVAYSLCEYKGYSENIFLDCSNKCAYTVSLN
jgi:hypothetical protein